MRTYTTIHYYYYYIASIPHYKVTNAPSQVLCFPLDIHPLALFPSTLSYKRFIPESLNRTIKQRSFLTRMRISNVFKNFLNEFNSKTIRDSNITLYDLKVKYLSTLETLTWGLGRETVETKSLRVCGEGEVSPTLTPSMGDEGQAYEVQVCGNTGISWRKKHYQVSFIVLMV